MRCVLRPSPRQLDQRLAAIGGQADPGRIGVLGDGIDHLDPFELSLALQRGQGRLESIEAEPAVVDRNPDRPRPARLDRSQENEIRRRFHQDDIAGVQKRLADQIDQLGRAGRDDRSRNGLLV